MRRTIDSEAVRVQVRVRVRVWACALRPCIAAIWVRKIWRGYGCIAARVWVCILHRRNMGAHNMGAQEGLVMVGLSASADGRSPSDMMADADGPLTHWALAGGKGEDGGRREEGREGGREYRHCRPMY